MDEKEEKLQIAKLAEQAERYDDMVDAMKKVVELAEGDLKDEERNFLSVAYKNVVGARRSAWRIIKSLEEKEEKANEETKRKLAGEYRSKIEEELKANCEEVLKLIDDHLYPKAEKSQSNNAAEAKVFYLKMKGDYYRYLVEICHTNKEWKGKSLQAYDKANTECRALRATHPIKLGLALNFSVFYYEIEEDAAKACELAQNAFDDALTDLENAEENTYKDSTLIMQLLRDNLTLWRQEKDEKDDEEGD